MRCRSTSSIPRPTGRSFPRRWPRGAGPRRTWSTPTTRGTSPITPSAGFPFARGLQGVPIQDNAHEWQGYIPFDAMPSAFDPPSGFLATANSRVTTDMVALPAVAGMGRSLPRRAHLQGSARPRSAQARRHAGRPDRRLQRGGSGAGPSLCLRHRPHPGADDRLRKAADLMRSWDGRLTTDSAAASIVTQARRALWPLILEPKLGKDAAETTAGPSPTLPRKRSSCTPTPTGFRQSLQELGRAADRRRPQGHERRQSPRRRGQWSYGSWHVVDIEHPLARFLPRSSAAWPEPARSPSAATPPPSSRWAATSAPRSASPWTGATSTARRRTLSWARAATPQPLLPRPVERLLTRHDLRAALHPASRSRANPPHAAPAAMRPPRISNPRHKAWVPHPCRAFVFDARAGNHKSQPALRPSLQSPQRSALP
jgi:acyl-homoserine lactone acylase PvdQ